MIRKLTVVFSTLIMVALISLTITSYQRRKTVYYYREPIKDMSFCIAVDRLSVRFWEWTFVDSPRPASNYEGVVLGFGMMVRRSKTPTNRTLLAHRITLPSPFLIVVFAIYPLLALLRGPIARWRRRKVGNCLKCGYDLTGNISGVCPECGRSITPASNADTPAGNATENG